MKIQIDHKAALDLVLSTGPYYTIMDRYESMGEYIGGHRDTWSWDMLKIKTLSTEQLIKIYIECESSFSRKTSVKILEQ